MATLVPYRPQPVERVGALYSGPLLREMVTEFDRVLRAITPLVSTLSSSGGGPAPIDATYITVSNNASLTSERRLAVTGAGLALTDAGANSTITIGLDADLNDIAAITRTRGDLIVGGASAWVDLAIGASGAAFVTNGTDPSWSLTPTWAGVHSFNSGIFMAGGNLELTGGGELLSAIPSTFSGGILLDQIPLVINQETPFAVPLMQFIDTTGPYTMDVALTAEMTGDAFLFIPNVGGTILTTIAAQTVSNKTFSIVGNVARVSTVGTGFHFEDQTTTTKDLYLVLSNQQANTNAGVSFRSSGGGTLWEFEDVNGIVATDRGTATWNGDLVEHNGDLPAVGFVSVI